MPHLCDVIGMPRVIIATKKPGTDEVLDEQVILIDLSTPHTIRRLQGNVLPQATSGTSEKICAIMRGFIFSAASRLASSIPGPVGECSRHPVK